MQLRRATLAAAAHACAVWQLFNRATVARDHHIARVFARRQRGQCKRVGLRRRQVFEAVHGEVHFAGQQSLFDLAHEHTTATERDQRVATVTVPLGSNGHEVELQRG